MWALDMYVSRVTYAWFQVLNRRNVDKNYNLLENNPFESEKLCQLYLTPGLKWFEYFTIEIIQ
jgi:hypothetical protein